MKDQDNSDSYDPPRDDTASKAAQTIESGPPNEYGLTTDTAAKLSLSRRSLLGLLIGIGGLGGWILRDRFLQTNQTTTQTTTQTPFQREQEFRDQYQSQIVPITPSFDYEMIDIEVSEPDPLIRQITASPAQSENGDRALFITDTINGVDISDLFIATWAEPADDGTSYQATIDQEGVTFSVRSGTDITIATAVQSSVSEDDIDEVYVVRGQTEETVEDLISSYSEFYLSVI